MKKVLRKSDLVAGVLVLVVVCLGIVLAGDVVVKEGDLAVDGDLATTGTVTWSGGGSANANTAYTHSQDNSQAHSDYLINNGDDFMLGKLVTYYGLETVGDVFACGKGTFGSLAVSSTCLVVSPYYGFRVGIRTSSPSYPLEVNDDVSDISIWASKKVSATGYITRTSVFDKSKNAWDYIKDAGYYLTDGKIDHKKFYGYAGEFEVTDYSRPVVIEEFDEDLNMTIDKTTYPYKTTEEGILLDEEINLLRQAVFELRQENQMLKAELAKLKEAVGVE